MIVGTILLLFVGLSFMALGGGNATIPEMHRQAVDHYHWLTDRQFIDLYAITRVTPGPSMLIVCLVGYAGAGWVGTLAAALAMFVPSSALAYFAGQAWHRFKTSPWRAALSNALAPLGVGLFLSGAWIIARGADHDHAAMLLTAITAALVMGTRLNLLIIMAVAGLIGWFQLV